MDAPFSSYDVTLSSKDEETGNVFTRSSDSERAARFELPPGSPAFVSRLVRVGKSLHKHLDHTEHVWCRQKEGPPSLRLGGVGGSPNVEDAMYILVVCRRPAAKCLSSSTVSSPTALANASSMRAA